MATIVRKPVLISSSTIKSAVLMVNPDRIDVVVNNEIVTALEYSGDEKSARKICGQYIYGNPMRRKLHWRIVIM